jgi:hypothetical protein
MKQCTKQILYFHVLFILEGKQKNKYSNRYISWGREVQEEKQQSKEQLRIIFK